MVRPYLWSRWTRILPRQRVKVLALDTNILVRYFTNDIPTQAGAARSLIHNLTAEKPGFIGREVALEAVWVLERSYGFTRTETANALLDLLDNDGIVVETTDDVANAAELYAQSPTNFSDLLILAAANRAGATPSTPLTADSPDLTEPPS